MKEFTLPEKEETQIKVNVGDKSVVIDFFDFDQIYSDSIQEIRNAGVTDTKSFLGVFCQKLQDLYDIELSHQSAMSFIGSVLEYSEELKKKYSVLQNSSDITDSTSEPSETPKQPSDS